MIDTISHLYNHLVSLVIQFFNEGWGQFNSDEMYQICKELIQQDFMIQPQGGLVKKIAMLSVVIFIFEIKSCQQTLNVLYY